VTFLDHFSFTPPSRRALRDALRPAGPRNSASGDVDPTSIDDVLLPTEQATHTVTLAFAQGEQIEAADVVFIVDESGSMEGEQAWLAEMVEDFDDALVEAGITDNRGVRLRNRSGENTERTLGDLRNMASGLRSADALPR
jgi:hypothetical protein